MMQFGRGLNAASYAALKKKKSQRNENLSRLVWTLTKRGRKTLGGVPPRSAAVAGADDGVSGGGV